LVGQRARHVRVVLHQKADDTLLRCRAEIAQRFFEACELFAEPLLLGVELLFLLIERLDQARGRRLLPFRTRRRAARRLDLLDDARRAALRLFQRRIELHGEAEKLAFDRLLLRILLGLLGHRTHNSTVARMLLEWKRWPRHPTSRKAAPSSG